VAQRVGFRPLFLPGVLAQPPLDAVQSGTVAFDEIVAAADSDISPTSDDRPFFYQFERGVPESLQPLLWGLAAIVAVGGAMSVAGQRRARPRALRRAPLYFAALGTGFMLVEVAVIQQVRLFLGHPTLAVTTALAVLLIAGGLGSGLAGRLGRTAGGAETAVPVGPALAAALLVLIWSLCWPLASRALLAAALPLRILVVVAGLAPLAFVMGMPFPLGLRWAGRGGSQPVALGWAVNGVMSVAGSTLAVTLAILAGFSRVLWAGAAIYLAAALVASFLRAPEAAWEPAILPTWPQAGSPEEEVQATGAQDQRVPASG